MALLRSGAKHRRPLRDPGLPPPARPRQAPARFYGAARGVGPGDLAGRVLRWREKGKVFGGDRFSLLGRRVRLVRATFYGDIEWHGELPVV